MNYNNFNRDRKPSINLKVNKKTQQKTLQIKNTSIRATILECVTAHDNKSHEPQHNPKDHKPTINQKGYKRPNKKTPQKRTQV